MMHIDDKFLENECQIMNDLSLSWEQRDDALFALDMYRYESCKRTHKLHRDYHQKKKHW